MRSTQSRRILSAVLGIFMLLSLVSMPVLAEETAGTVTASAVAEAAAGESQQNVALLTEAGTEAESAGNAATPAADTSSTAGSNEAADAGNVSSAGGDNASSSTDGNASADTGAAGTDGAAAENTSVDNVASQENSQTGTENTDASQSAAGTDTASGENTQTTTENTEGTAGAGSTSDATQLNAETGAESATDADADNGGEDNEADLTDADADTDAEDAEGKEDSEDEEEAQEQERRRQLEAEFPNLRYAEYSDKQEINTKVDASYSDYPYEVQSGFLLMADGDDDDDDPYDLTDEEVQKLRELEETTKTYDEAVAETRTRMNAREESFSITFVTSSPLSETTIYSRFWTAVFKHTGVPTEGDYLAYQWGWHSISADMTSFGSRYYYTFNIQATYYNTAAQETQADAAFRAAATALGLTSSSLTDYQKMYLIYSYVLKKANYTITSDYTMYTGYGAIANGAAVCQGYAVAIYRLALMAGLDARVIPNTKINHAWNIVKVGSAYYNCDATWDDTSSNSSVWKYFLCGDASRSSSSATKTFYDCHISSSGYYRPSWVGSSYNVSSSFYPCFKNADTSAAPAVSLPVSGSSASACVTGSNGLCTRCGQVTHQSHVHSYDQKLETETYLVTAATCTQYAVYRMSCLCGEAGSETFNGTTYADHTDADGDGKCDVCQAEVSTEPAAKEVNRTVRVSVGSNMVAYANGSIIPVDSEGYIDLTDCSAKAITTIEYSSSDTATNYPVQTSMKVYFITEDAEGNLTAMRDTAFDGILQYYGASVRCDGSKGIRVITGIPQTALAALKGSGLNGWKYVDSGTLIGNDSALNGSAVVIGSAKSSYVSFSSNPFKNYGTVDGYTNGLTFTSLDQCTVTFSIRPYLTITNGIDQVTLYGGIVHRSIGYVSYQNRNAFNATTQATNYNYIWEIIRYCGLAE